MVDKDVVRRGYDELAETYAAERSEEDRERAALEAFFESLPASPTVLDAGCGQGTPVLQRGSEDGAVAAVGIDFSREQLELAAANAPMASLVQGDLTDLPFHDGVFDAVIALHSLIHVPLDDHRTVLEECARVLRPGGRVLVSEGLEEWRGENPDWLETGVEMQWHVAGAATTRTQLRETGFEIVDERGVSGTLCEDERWVYVAGRLEN
ncbi:Methyltransferase type 11 [Haloterrigena turkmenica DSM 5511]|uniref:Methyltransferase type 11 n=1 Tax=Haloterrigena turkmenica (strain ATCC 51198 / DSM 5511 / JCM 9101 / NCIMB 13204 / VKM B-1734 / 4k) TaxID=543526 RepID=D2RPW4_HALTV|nr:class I SAM-dependent methyltransferase [Haloterrigena turkmenica]ADB60223.1 Methyltransferase type 11 [Haloterrigena turkmenica DSM 5511]